jgi:preprotein translocase subunit SecE
LPREHKVHIIFVIVILLIIIIIIFLLFFLDSAILKCRLDDSCRGVYTVRR